MYLQTHGRLRSERTYGNVCRVRCRHIAVCCNVFQGVAVCCSAYVANIYLTYVFQVSGGVLQRVAMCCSVLQCVAVCCSVLQCVAVCCSVLQCACNECLPHVCVPGIVQCAVLWCSALQRAAVYCSVLPCVAVCVSRMVTSPMCWRHIAVRCIVLHHVAVCCSMLQYACWKYLPDVCVPRSLLHHMIIFRIHIHTHTRIYTHTHILIHTHTHTLSTWRIGSRQSCAWYDNIPTPQQATYQ